MKCSQDCPDLRGVAEVYDLTVPEKIISPHVVRQTGRGEGQPVVAEGDAEPLETHVDQSHQQSDRENYHIKTRQSIIF